MRRRRVSSSVIRTIVFLSIASRIVWGIGPAAAEEPGVEHAQHLELRFVTAKEAAKALHSYFRLRQERIPSLEIRENSLFLLEADEERTERVRTVLQHLDCPPARVTTKFVDVHHGKELEKLIEDVLAAEGIGLNRVIPVGNGQEVAIHLIPQPAHRIFLMGRPIDVARMEERISRLDVPKRE